MLYSHGNAGNLSHRGADIVRWSDALNVSVLIYDYPGFGKSTGSPSEAGCLAAADGAWKWLTTEAKVEPERVILFGKSLGGALAIDLASRKQHRALIVARSFTSIPDVAQEVYPWLPARWICGTKFSILEKGPLCNRPVFVHHGALDEVVRPHHSQSLYEAFPGPKQIMIDPNGHHDSAFSADAFAQIRGFLSDHA